MLHVLTHDILPVFAMLALGFLLGRTQYVARAEAVTLNRVAFMVLQPALILPLIAGLDWSGFSGRALAGYAGAQVGLFTLTYLLCRRILGRDPLESWLLSMAVIFVNTLLYIWPIAQLIYGPGTVLPVTGIVAWDSAVSFSFFIITTDLIAGRMAAKGRDGVAANAVGGVAANAADGVAANAVGGVAANAADGMTANAVGETPAPAAGPFPAAGPSPNTSSPPSAVKRLARNPVLIAIALGFVLNVAGLGLPAPIHTALEFSGRAAAPLTLFALGVILSGHTLRLSPTVASVTLLKLAAFPALVWAVMHALSPPGTWADLVTLTAAGPSGAMAFALALLHGVRTDSIAPVIVWTSTLSLISLAWLA